MTAVEKFDLFLDEFKKTHLWKAMENTHENSPFHREFSTGVHTSMLISWYKENILASRSEKQIMLSLIACCFHDTGKPQAEITKYSEERGEYRAYHGHELISARIWTDYALTHRDQMEQLELSLVDISNIALMVEYHVPFGLKDMKKRSSLKKALLHRLGVDGHQAFIDLLNSDQHGRISDNMPAKLAEVAAWIEEWENVT